VTADTPADTPEHTAWQRFQAADRAARADYLAAVQQAQQEYATITEPARATYSATERAAWIAYNQQGKAAWAAYRDAVGDNPMPAPRSTEVPPRPAHHHARETAPGQWMPAPVFTPTRKGGQ
jgi:1,4-alpha-glucan branching enzyme